jgi:tetratricopeptide (TPR) repeat protein
VNLFEGPREQAVELAERVRGGSRVNIASEQGAILLLHETAQRLEPNAVVIHVPRDLDKTAYVLLSAAAQCGLEPLQKTAEKLAASQSDPSAALAVLSKALGRRPLFVSELDALTKSAGDEELRDVFDSTLKRVHRWLDKRALLVTNHSVREEDARPRIERPRTFSQWDAQKLWKRVGQNVETYTLAVTRALLLGAEDDDPSLEWDAASIVDELWRGMPLDMRELVALLSVHGRPIERTQFAPLNLVPTEIIEMGIRAHLIEQSRGQLWLTASPTWRELLTPAVRRECHQRLADAFASVVHEAYAPEAAPLAVLEAHRHYAAIPDVERARGFAQFGVGQLLASAKQLSWEKEPAKAARTYDVVLQLDDQLRQGGETSGIGARARAYAVHYRAFNRYKSNADDPRETLSHYREALALWPQNALFWSRTIRCCFAADLYEEGVRTRDSAFDAVPKHHQRAAFIIGRTVERLLRRNRILAAVLVWRDHPPQTLGEKEVQRELLVRIAQGWKEHRLWAQGQAPLMLRTPVPVSISAQEQNFSCSLLGRKGKGSSPVMAWTAAVQEVAAEFLALVEDPSPSPENVERKRYLMDLLDFEALRTPSEPLRWMTYLASLEERVARGEVTQAQHHCLLRTWRQARQHFPKLRRPTVGRTEEGRLYLSWAFAERPHVVLTVDIEPDGRVDWFYRDQLQQSVSGTEDEPEEELPQEVFLKLAAFAS